MSDCVSDSNGDCKYYWILFMILYCCIHKIFKLLISLTYLEDL